MKTTETQSAYSDKGFWQKIRRYAKKAGAEVLDKALTLYYAAMDPETPAWARGAIFGVLGYFITPLDAIPDAAPAVGFSDDLSLMVGALVAVTTYVKSEHRQRAREKLQRWKVVEA